MPKTLYCDNTVLTTDKVFTFMSADAVAGATSIGVVSTVGFVSLGTSSGQILCIGEIGQERSEIIKTSSATGPGGTSVTLVSSGLRFDHPQDTKVYIIDWDRWEVQTAATVSGTKSTLTTYPRYLDPEQDESIYRDTTVSSGFYFIRYNESITNTYSDWSDAIPYAGYPDNSVFSIKERALETLNQKVDSEIITSDFLNHALWEGRREYHNSPGKRPFRRKYNTDIGNVGAGQYRAALPADIEKGYGAENVFGVRIGTHENLEYYDKKDWDADYENSAHTNLNVAYAVGDQDLWCDNVRDFEDSGSVMLNGTTLTYSARGVSGGTLRISTQGEWGSDGSTDDVWQNRSHGLPTCFTVWADVGGSAYIYFSQPLDTAYVGQNIFLDYYRKVVDLDSDADELDEPQYDMFVPYLAYRVKQRLNSGLNSLSDPQYQEWILRKTNALQAENLMTEIRISPSIDHLLMR